MKRIPTFRYLKRKHFLDKNKIRSVSTNLSNSFDNAYTTASTILKKSLIEAESLQIALEGQIDKILDKIEISENFEPSEKDEKIAKELGEKESLIESNNDSLLSLSEMRIVFLFKTIENAIVRMTDIAFPKAKKKTFFRWDVIVDFLKINGVKIDKINGYEAVNQLRVVNNNIKHSLNIDESTKKFRFWIHETDFTYENLYKFYKSIHEPKAKVDP